MSQAIEDRVGPPSRVLVAAPDEPLRSMLEDVVLDMGLEVVAHAGERDATAALDGSRFDLVILGIDDPPADAVRLARRIISERRGTDLIVIADPSVVSVAEAKRLGAFDILVRPLQDAGLVPASIDRVLEKQRLESELRRAREGSLLSDAGQVIGSSLDINQVYEDFADRVRLLIPSDRVSIGVTDKEEGTTTTIYSWGVDIPEVRPGEVTADPPEAFVRDSHRTGIIQTSTPERSEENLPGLTAARRAGLRSFLTLPLVYQNRTVGSLGLRSLEDDAYTGHHLELAERMALLIAPAIAHAQLYSDLTETRNQLQQAHDELEQRVERRTGELAASEVRQRHLAEENQVMADLGRIMSSSLDIEEIYDVFVERVIKHVIPSDALTINLIDAEKGSFSAAYRRGPVGVMEGLGSPGSLAGSVSEEVVESRAPVVISAENIGDTTSKYPKLRTQIEAGMRSFLVVPLIFKDDVFGTVAFDSTRAGNYSDHEVRLAQGIATQISGAVVNSQLYAERARAQEASQRLAGENGVLAEIGRNIGSTLEIGKEYPRFESEVQRLVRFDQMVVYTLDATRLTMTAQYEGGSVSGDRSTEVPLWDVPTAWSALQTMSGVLVQGDELERSMRRSGPATRTVPAWVRADVTVPLISQDTVIGFLALRSRAADMYTEHDVELLERVGRQITPAIVNAELHRSLRQTQEELQRLLAASPAMIFRATAAREYITTFISENVKAVLGLESEAIVADPGVWSRHIHPSDRRRLSQEAVPALFDRGEAASEYRFLDAAGNYRWLYERVELLYDTDGKPLEVVGSVVDITELKDAQQGLAESEERYRTLFEQSQDAITISTADGRYIDVNESFLDLIGYSRDEVADLDVDTLYADDEERAQMRQQIAEVGAVRDYELRLRRKDGTSIDSSITTTARHDADGRLIGYQGIIRDVTELNRLSQIGQIVSSSLDIDEVYELCGQQVRELLPFDSIMFATVDWEQRTVRVDYQVGAELYESPMPTGTTIPLEESIAEQVLKQEGGLISRRSDSPETGDGTVQLHAPVGGSDPYTLLSVPLLSGGRPIAVMYLLSMEEEAFTERDLSLAQRVSHLIAGAIANAQLYQDAQQRAEEVLRLSQFNERVIASAPAALAVLRGRDQTVTSVNPAFEQTFRSTNGAARESIEGKPLAEVVPMEGLSTVIEEAFMAGEPARQREMHFTDFAGVERWFLVSATRLRGEGGPERSEMESLLVLDDITEQRQHQEALQETARLASIGELAAGVAHEINNPLAVVVGFSELLLGGDLPPAEKGQIERVHFQAQRAAKIVHNLLAFSRRREPEKRHGDLTAVLERAIELKEHDFRLNDIRVTRRYTQRLPHTMVDEHEMTQVVLNILTNAEQAMVELRGKGELLIQARRSRGSIRISITDDGPGIPPEELFKVFDPFFTSKEVGKGTGLGLSMCYGIVQRHGGKIWAESDVGKGAAFHIELPILSPEPSLTSQSAIARTELSSQRILVVDDEPDIRDLLLRVLSQAGHTVELASDGRSALDMVQAGQFDCAIMDVKMPGMDGRELYRRLKVLDPALARKVIFNTGDTVREEVSDFVRETGSPVLRKPFNASQLWAHLQDVAAR